MRMEMTLGRRQRAVPAILRSTCTKPRRGVGHPRQTLGTTRSASTRNPRAGLGREFRRPVPGVTSEVMPRGGGFLEVAVEARVIPPPGADAHERRPTRDRLGLLTPV